MLRSQRIIAMNIQPKITPVLDPGFVPAVLWNQAFEAKAAADPASHQVDIALTRNDGTCFRWSGKLLPHTGENIALNETYVERIVKFLLWQKGGNIILVAGDDAIADMLASRYCKGGIREFDWDFIGKKIYGSPIEVKKVSVEELPEEYSGSMTLGRNLDGCRIGFDLGGSDRKCAAVVNGEVVYSEEVVWDPYFQKDPQYHIDGIQDSLERAAAHLPRVDAIGGSSAGVIINSEVRTSSLFRGVSQEDIEKTLGKVFRTLQKEKWNNIPFEVVNDGEVTALAGAMGMNDNAVLGVAMGTSEAVGYVDKDKNVLGWINELAFAPVDLCENAMQDEWSTDIGVGCKYFSQDAVIKLAPAAGIELDENLSPAEKLKVVQALMEKDDPRAQAIFESIGAYLAYAVVLYSQFYDIEHMMMLGRVMSGKGGDTILRVCNEILADEYPALAKKCEVSLPDEKNRRVGQSIAAASLPADRA